MNEKLKSRKLIITVLILVVSFVMAHYAALTSELSTILISAISSYSAGNVLAGDKDRGDDKYLSSKYLLTIVIILGSCVTAGAGLMTGPLANILTATIASFNVAKGYSK